MAAAVICALIFFSKPIYFVSAVPKCSGGTPKGPMLADACAGQFTRRWQQRHMLLVSKGGGGPGPSRQGFSYLSNLLLLLWFSHVSLADNCTNRTF